MTDDLINRGFAVPTVSEGRRAGRSSTLCLYAIAAIALVFSLVIAVTAISIGIARAGALPPPFSHTTFRG